MTSRLHHALSDLAEQAPAPQTVLTSRVIARARRRRRVRLIAMPIAAAGAAAAVVTGSVLVGGTTDSAPPAVNVTVPRNGVLNDGALPGPLPKKMNDPVTYAFLDRCKQKDVPSGKGLTGDCAQWRLLGRSGRQWRLTEGVGSYPKSTGSYMNSNAPLTISPDGRRIAYYQAKDERFVVRELSSGRIVPIDRRVPMTELYRNPYTLVFSGDGRRLVAHTADDTVARKALLADTTTGAVSDLPSTSVVGVGVGQDSAAVVLTEKRGKQTNLVLTGPDGRVRNRVPLDPRVDLSMATGENRLSPDGRTLFANAHSEGEGMLVDVRTGKVTRTLSTRLPGGEALTGIVGWTGPSEVLTSTDPPGSPWKNPPGRPGRQDDITGIRGLIINLHTGGTKLFGDFKLRASQVAFQFGGYRS
ncbi:hypothetical protein ACGFNU_38770 [Spirillospora sp. NPDC048911]|uniref:hypothetical protein n=1 Tax=Spirillospora sp. NPDC048911 TaxID=3364527 RepID=UPI00371439F5